VTDNVISYLEMCQREGCSLQQGMNFGLGKTHSVVLMSVRPNAPYRDRLEDGGSTLIYEGHDQPRGAECKNPKTVDQPLTYAAGGLTQNGKFTAAALAAKRGERSPERVRVYEKIKPGIWAYNGLFHLLDAWLENDGERAVCKFRLHAIDEDEPTVALLPIEGARRRIIPSNVKLEVWKRDGGRCALCGATDELHFDHIVPFSKGGTSLTVENVQLLCARHNLQKSDRIE
jgi:hypothetical protein